MTGQIPDTIHIEDYPWAIASRDWAAFKSAVPSSESLGFRTCMEHTGNWEGRVNAFAIRNGRLYLHEARVHLAPESRDFMPEAGSRRDETRTSWSEVFEPGDEHGRRELTTRKTTTIVFDDLPVHYSGELVAARDLNTAYYFHGGIQTPNRFGVRLYLYFDEGRVLREKSRFDFGSTPDEMTGLVARLFAKSFGVMNDGDIGPGAA